MVGDTVAQLLVEIGADLSGLLDGLQTAKGALDQFATTSGGAADEQDVFGERVSARLRAIARDYQTLGQSESEAAASAEALRGAMESSVLAGSQRRTDKFTPSEVDPLDAAVSTRLEQVGAQYRLLGQSEEMAAASAQLLRPAIEEAVTDQAQARLERLVPTLKEVGASANPLAGIFGKVGDQFKQIGTMAAGMATGMLAANVVMGVAERFKTAAEQIDTFGSAVRKVSVVTGASAEDSSRLIAVFERYGLTGDDAANKLSRFERALMGADTALDLQESGGKRGAQVLQEFGVQTRDAAGHVLPMIDVLLNLSDRWKEMDAESRNAAARTLFGGLGGAGGEQMNLLLSQGKQNLQDVIAKAEQYGLVLSGENLNDVIAFTMAHREMDMALQGVSVRLGAAFMPAITSAAEVLTGLTRVVVSDLVPMFKQVPAWIGPATLGFVGLGIALKVVQGAASLAGVPLGLLKNMLVEQGARAGVAAVENTALAGSEAAVGSAAATATPEVAGLGAAGGTAGGLLAGLAQTALVVGAAIYTLSQPLRDALEIIKQLQEGIAHIPEDQMSPIQKMIAGLVNAIPTELPKVGPIASITDQIDKIKRDVADAVKSTSASASAGSEGAGAGSGAPVSAGLKAAQEASDAAKKQLQDIQDEQTSRKLDFDASHVDMEAAALNGKLAETDANAQLLDYKREIEDLDRSAIDEANQRLKLDEQDAVTRAQIAESAQKAQDEDLGYQQNLLKAQLRASHHGGPPVDSSAVHAELRQLHKEQIDEAPALLIAEHNVQLADRTKGQTDLQDQLKNSTLQRAKIGIEDAMQPLVDAATAAKRLAENAQTALDMEKQKFAIEEQSYQLALLRAQLDAKKAEHDLYTVQHPDSSGGPNIEGGVHVTVYQNPNGGLDHLAIVDAVYAGITKAAQDAKSPPVVLSPRVGGARYAAA